MKKGQVFTIDLVVGSIIILGVITSAYAISTYYFTLNSSITTNSDFISQTYSAVSAFSTVTSTTNNLLILQNGGSNASFVNYVSATLKGMIPGHFLLQVFTQANYSSTEIPNQLVFSYSSGFSSAASYSNFYEPVLIANYSSACGNSCNSSLSIKSVFPSYNDTINAPNCAVLYDNDSSTGWTTLNDTPSGYCTIEIPYYAAPNSYIVETASSTGSSTGSATLHVIALDLLEFEVER